MPYDDGGDSHFVVDRPSEQESHLCHSSRARLSEEKAAHAICKVHTAACPTLPISELHLIPVEAPGILFSISLFSPAAQ